MKILILGSVALPVPPPMQGGTERIAYFQAKGLSAQGPAFAKASTGKHDVTLIAAHGSKPDPAYRLVEIGGGDTVAESGTQVHSSLRSDRSSQFTEGSRNLRKELVYMAEVSQYLFDQGHEYDVILNNMRGGESVLLPIAKNIGVPLVTVMHLPLFDELADLFRRYDTPVITISNAQRKGFVGVNFVGTVYNCVEPSLFVIPANGKQKPIPDQVGDDKYLLMMGSIAPHKNQKDGILAAKKLGKTIILAGKIGNQAYFDVEIKPHLGDTVIHKGEMGLEEKAQLLAGAEALLFPVLWPEPFGLVMIEAMAVGTPVVAYNNGAVPEVVADGKTGFIVEGVDGLVDGVRRIGSIDRAACRRHVEEHFTVGKMIDNLDSILQKVASS